MSLCTTLDLSLSLSTRNLPTFLQLFPYLLNLKLTLKRVAADEILCLEHARIQTLIIESERGQEEEDQEGEVVVDASGCSQLGEVRMRGEGVKVTVDQTKQRVRRC